MYLNNGNELREKYETAHKALSNLEDVSEFSSGTITFEELEKKVIEWGYEREIFSQSSPHRQYGKLDEEMGELFYGLTWDEDLVVKDSIGDMMVVLAIIARFKGYTLTECLEFAYNEIKNRKGKMVNGIFVKEEE